MEPLQATAETYHGNPMEYVDSKEMSTAVDLESGEEIQYQLDFLVEGEYQYLRTHIYIQDPKKRGSGEWGMGWESIEMYNWR